MTDLALARVPAGQSLGGALALGILLLAGASAVVGCAKAPGTLLILQNQIPVVDSTSGVCAPSADSSDPSLGSGRFDVFLDRFYPYFAYPLIQNRLPSLKTAGEIERNSLLLTKVRVEIRAPAGVDPRWAVGCPGSFDTSVAGILDPGSVRSVTVEALRPCHAERLNQMIAAGDIPGNLAQPVSFTLELTAIADRSGSEQKSDVFPFDVQVCAGCLQSMFPKIPACADAPKPNPLHGNPCNIAQDGPAVLCCASPGGAVVCPSPDS